MIACELALIDITVTNAERVFQWLPTSRPNLGPKRFIGDWRHESSVPLSAISKLMVYYIALYHQVTLTAACPQTDHHIVVQR